MVVPFCQGSSYEAAVVVVPFCQGSSYEPAVVVAESLWYQLCLPTFFLLPYFLIYEMPSEKFITT
jgi:hypothetical protein